MLNFFIALWLWVKKQSSKIWIGSTVLPVEQMPPFKCAEQTLTHFPVSGYVKIPIPKLITAEWLRSQDACDTVCDEFACLFPAGAPVTIDTACASDEFDIDWLASKMLTTAGHALYKQRLDTAEVQYSDDTKEATQRYSAAWKSAAAALEQRLKTLNITDRRSPEALAASAARDKVIKVISEHYAEYAKVVLPAIDRYRRAKVEIIIGIVTGELSA